jgi:hypothetical protein
MRRLLLLSLLLVACPAQPQGLSIADVTVGYYDPAETPIVLRGDSASTVRLTIGYDREYVQILEVISAAALLDTFRIDTGTVEIALADSAPMSGVLGYIRFRAIQEKDWKTALTVQRADVDSLTVPLTDGWVTIRPWTLRDLTVDGVLDEQDVMMLWRAVALTLPHQVAQLHPRWWLERANVHENYLDNGYPLVNLLDVVALMRRL